MKKFLLLLLILAVQPAVTRITAQTLLTDGKVWNCVRLFYGGSLDDDDINVYYSYAVIGDTVVNGMECRLLEQRWPNSPNTRRFAALEKDSCLYNILEDGTLCELLKFNLKVGDTYDFNGEVVAVDTIKVRGVRRKRISIKSFSTLYYIVEGIGISNNGYRSEEANSFYHILLSVTEFGDTVFTASDFVAPAYSSQEYYPVGTKWTEIRVDTVKYDSWYSRVGEEWIPNFDTVEYYVSGEYLVDNYEYPMRYKIVHTQGSDWSDPIPLLVLEDQFGIQVSIKKNEEVLFPPGTAYSSFENWKVGNVITYLDIIHAGITSWHDYWVSYGTIQEIKTAYFGGSEPLTYAELDNGRRIIQGIGITEWPDGECLFGSVWLYELMGIDHSRKYRSMLVHFERNGETLYDVWPQPGQSWLDVKTPVITSKKEDSNAIYDLQGRRLNAVPQKGLYIRNGKKCEIKP